MNFSDIPDILSIISFTWLAIDKFKKNKLKILLFKECPLTLSFTPNGLSLKLRFSIYSINKESLIHRIHISLKRSSDNKITELKWSFLENPSYTWAGNMYNQLTLNSEYLARDIKIKSNELEALYVTFVNDYLNNEIKTLCCELKNIIKSYIINRNIQIDLNNFDIQIYNINEELEKLDEIKTLLEKIFDNCFWLNDTYTIDLKITYNFNKIFHHKFNFCINPEINKIEKNNFLKGILRDTLSDLYKNPSICGMYNNINPILEQDS